MTTDEQQQPLKEVSLRFPDGSMGSGGKTSGAFDGDVQKMSPFSYLTRQGQGTQIPEPPAELIEAAERKGIDNATGLITQPEWLSVLKKRQAPWAWLRWIFCNGFCNPRFTLTRAQWVWFVNVTCLGLQLYFGFTMFDKASQKKAGAMEVTVWRMKPMWNASETDGYTAQLIDNMNPIRFDVILLSVYFLTSLMHFFVVILGPFDRWISVLWRQLDLAFLWWRHLVQMATLPIVGLIVCCITNVRDQNTLTSIFFLFWVYAASFFVTELYSRPHRNVDRTYDMYRWTADEAPVRPGVPFNDLTAEEMCQRVLQRGRRRSNYLKRILPLGLGLVTFITAWTIILDSFFQQLRDLRIDSTDDLYKRIPAWVPAVVLGSLVFMAAQLAPTVWWQWVQPQNYWKTEIFYAIWTLFFNGYLWMYFNSEFFDYATFNMALALDHNATAVY